MTTLAADVRTYATESRSHVHAHHQLVLPLAGAMALDAGGRALRLDGAVGGAVAAGERHTFAGTRGGRFVVVDLDAAQLRADAERRWIERATRGVAFAIAPAVDRLVAAGADLLEGPVSAERRRRWAGLLVLTLVEEAGAGTRLPDRLLRARDFIRRRFADPIGVADVARAAGLGASQLHALFVRWLGTTPMALVTEARLERAARLLAGTELPIAEVALRAGFADQSALGRCLRRRRGTTPAALRRRARAG